MRKQLDEHVPWSLLLARESLLSCCGGNISYAKGHTTCRGWIMCRLVDSKVSITALPEVSATSVPVLAHVPAILTEVQFLPSRFQNFHVRLD
jgi:hypothetical protein